MAKSKDKINKIFEMLKVKPYEKFRMNDEKYNKDAVFRLTEDLILEHYDNDIQKWKTTSYNHMRFWRLLLKENSILLEDEVVEEVEN